MTSSIAPESLSPVRLWAGGIITGLVVAFLLFDGVTKIMRVAPVVEASQKLGMTTGSLPAIGIVLLICTALYAVPSTAILGAILLTGFLGGATAIHVRAESGTFPVVFSIAFGLLAWLGLVLREPRLFWWILQRH
jgi:hypothetical protein